MESHKASAEVIYIMGSGHSGSTVLDIVLGNHPDIVSVGELSNFITKRKTDSEYCACGEPANRCQFWSNIYWEWTDRVKRGEVEEYLSLQNTFEHFKHWFHLQRTKRDDFQSPRFQAYAEGARALFEAISVVSGKNIIVDSSKNPVRALALSMVPGIDLRLVHLVRDGRGIVWSFRKKRGKEKNIRAKLVYSSPWLASFEWVLNNAASGFLLTEAYSQGIRIRYEDLVEQPGKVLTDMGRALEIGLEPVIDALLSGKEMRIGHNIAGNRVRMTGSIRLKPDCEWKERLPRYDQRVFWLLAGSLAKKYGYRWH
ncbi:MAG: sulfotransferase [Deltaproteobacteria bacterium]|nr:sulfotransferase [Deltaproteobacteria bacterium]